VTTFCRDYSTSEKDLLLENLSAHVTALDFRAIESLKARYFRCVDTKDWRGLRSLYTDDAKFDGFAFDGSTPDTFVRGVADFLAGTTSVHHGFTCELVALGNGKVRGQWAMHDYVVWAPGSRGYKGTALPGQWGFEGYGHYEEEYVRTPDGWRFSFQRLTRLRVEVLTGPAREVSQASMRPATPYWMEIGTSNADA
jgi:hypothetical protein